MIALLAALASADPLPIDRVWDVLTPSETWRPTLRQAGEKLGDRTIEFCGLDVDGSYLVALADASPDEPFVRVVREHTRRPIDVADFARFLDDVLARAPEGQVFVTAGRARSEGILVHPDDVFLGKPRRYGRSKALAIDEPVPQADLPPAADGDPLGPNWTTRYENPEDEAAILAALRAVRPGYADRIASLVAQLRAQGAEVYVTSTVRFRERGYLMWGAFVLSRAGSEADLDAALKKVEAANADWKLDVHIAWRSPDGWQATREAARQMADTYDVVYATETGARTSDHYTGEAADFVATGLPRSLTLEAPDGAKRTFDLSDPEQTRDLSLTPELIAWIEQHFGMSKLKSDYPHWRDVTPPT